MEKYQIISDFIDFLKNYKIPENGKITRSMISKNVPYSNRHFDRIFKNFSKYTPLELAEILRLLSCIDSIKNGNTLKNTAYDYDYTPEGLSNVLRSKMNLNVQSIRTQDFQFEKYQMYSTFMVRLNAYTYQLDKEYELLLEYGIQEIFNGLKEVEVHIGEVFDIVFQCNIVGNKVIIQLHTLFTESMLWFNEFKDIN